MPWFWNDEGYFPDLEWKQKNKIAGYKVNKDRMDYWLKKKFFSKEITGHESRKSETGNDKTEKMHQFQPCDKRDGEDYNQQPRRRASREDYFLKNETGYFISPQK